MGADEGKGRVREDQNSGNPSGHGMPTRGGLRDRGQGPLQTRIIQGAHSRYQLGFARRMTSDREAHGLIQCIQTSDVAHVGSQLDQLAQPLE